MNVRDLLPDGVDIDLDHWVISPKTSSPNTMLLTFVPENVVYMPGKRRYPCILAFTSRVKAQRYLQDNGLGRRYSFLDMPMLDIIGLAIEMPGNVAIDRKDDDTPFVWINLIRMMRDYPEIVGSGSARGGRPS